jgi:hypothetical protein
LASGNVKDKVSSLSKDRHFFETKIEYEGIKLPIKIPLSVNAEEVGDVSLLFPLVSVFTYRLFHYVYSFQNLVFSHQVN